MNEDELVKWLEDELSNAKFSWDVSSKLSMNSYGAGYDAGYMEAIEKVLKQIQDV